MIDKETYKKEIVRMWDSIRDDKYKGIKSCSGVTYCDECPLYKIGCGESSNAFIGCGESSNAFEMIEFVEQWSKENPPKKYKVSKENPPKKYKVSKRGINNDGQRNL